MEIGRIPAVVLAAGYSSRMNAFKPLLPLGEGLVLEHVVESLRRAGVEDIHLVTGYDRERLTEIQKAFGLKEAHNPDFDRGMFSSIQAGVRNLPTDAPGCFLVPVDCPLFGSETIVKMARELGDGSVFAVPTYMGKKGHPLFVPRKHFAEIFQTRREGRSENHYGQVLRRNPSHPRRGRGHSSGYGHPRGLSDCSAVFAEWSGFRIPSAVGCREKISSHTPRTNSSAQRKDFSGSDGRSPQ